MNRINIVRRVIIILMLTIGLPHIMHGEDNPDWKRLNKYKEELKTTQDPVGLAIEMTKDSFEGCRVEGMPVLAKHWEDPRSEARLREIAENKPRKHLGEGIFYTEGAQAYGCLRYVLTKKAERDLAGKKDPKDKLTLIREFFVKRNYLDGAANAPMDNEAWQLVKTFLKIAIGIDKGAVMDIVVKEGRVLHPDELSGYIKTYLNEAIAYAKQIGPRNTLNEYGYFGVALDQTKNERVIALYEGWLKDELERSDMISTILRHLGQIGGKQYLLNRLKNESRPAVVSWIATELASPFSEFSKIDQETLSTIRGAVERLKQNKEVEDNSKYLQYVIDCLEQRVAEKEKKEKSKNEK